MAARKHPLMQRFMDKALPEPNSGCWLWTGNYLQSGYGRIDLRRLSAEMDSTRAHRVAYRLFKGDIPPNMLVCHECDNPSCVNPDHLFLGTCADNHADRNKKERQARGDKQWSVKLTEADVRTIRNSLALSSILAAQFGVFNSTIRKIRSRKTWQHVKDVP